MAFPITVTFREMAHSDDVEEHIRKKAAKLDRWAHGILNCSVALEVPHRHHQHGNQYRVRIVVTLPRETVVVGHRACPETDRDHSYQDPHAAIEAAFDEARRQLVEIGDRRRALMHARAEEEDQRETRARESLS